MFGPVPRTRTTPSPTTTTTPILPATGGTIVMGRTVRTVTTTMATSTTTILCMSDVLRTLSISFSMITCEDIFTAYFQCRKNKRNTTNALKFELNYESNVIQLYEDIIS